MWRAIFFRLISQVKVGLDFWPDSLKLSKRTLRKYFLEGRAGPSGLERLLKSVSAKFFLAILQQF